MALVYLVPFFLLICILEDRLSTSSTSPNRFGMGLPGARTADFQGSVEFTL